MKPLITDSSKWGLDEQQEIFIKSICLFNICAKIYKNTFNYVDNLLLSRFVKEYDLLIIDYSHNTGLHTYQHLLNWSIYMLEYSRIYSKVNNIVHKRVSLDYIEGSIVIWGARAYGLDTIKNSDIGSKPRILSSDTSTLFLKSRPDAIMNIGISSCYNVEPSHFFL